MKTYSSEYYTTIIIMTEVIPRHINQLFTFSNLSTHRISCKSHSRSTVVRIDVVVVSFSMVTLGRILNIQTKLYGIS